MVVSRVSSVCLGLLLAACAAGSAQRSPVTAQVEPAVSPIPQDVVVESTVTTTTTTTEGHFPAGRGTVSTVDELWTARTEASAGFTPSMAGPETFESRLKTAQRALGSPKVEGLRVDNPPGMAFRGVGAKDIHGAFSCHELVVPERGMPMVRRIDNKECGLPYALFPDSTYSGAGPRWTSTKLKAVMKEMAGMPAHEALGLARIKLGNADRTVDDGTTAAAAEWVGLGGRGDQAPFSCHVLRVNNGGGSSSTNLRIEEREISRCGLSWPMDGMTFDPGRTSRLRTSSRRTTSARRVVRRNRSASSNGERLRARTSSRPTMVSFVPSIPMGARRRSS